MKLIFKLTLISLSIFLNRISLTSDKIEWPDYPGIPGGKNKFIQVDGMLLKTPNGKPFIIKGIALGNHVWSNPQTSERFTHHGPDDFARIKSMGFNSVRFYLNYGLFENDSKPYIYKQSGFDWIDKNIAAARKHGIYIVLNMHVPQGGFQSNGNGDELWTNPECRARLTALWKEIAKRYSNEDIIIGYGLLNEPVPNKSCEQWKDLAQQITDAVRSVDTNHILFIERVNWLKFASSPSDRENMYFPEIKDPAPKKNIIYEYHAYSPIEFTHQNASWIPLFKNKFAVYPDSSRINAEGETWLGFSEGNPEAGSGSFEWKTLISNNVKPIKKEYKIGKPVIQVQNIGRSGKLWIDEITIEEFNSAGKKIKTITSSIDGDKGWHFWSRNNSGKISSESNIDGAVTGNCLTASGTTDDAVATLDSLKFIINNGSTYRISGKVKGSNIQKGAIVRFRIDYYGCDLVYSWNKDGLKAIVDEYIRFSKKRNVPLYLGEFGVYADTFRENRGGERWLSDMLDILTAGKINYNYHTYHESGFGIFMNDDHEFPNPDYLNKTVVNIFASKQKVKPH